MTDQPFPMNAIVSVIKNRLLCPFNDYRTLLNHMTGRQLGLWDVTRAREVCTAKLIRMHPELGELPNPPEKTDSGNANKYIRQCVKANGGVDTYTLAPSSVKFAEQHLSEALSA